MTPHPDYIQAVKDWIANEIKEGIPLQQFHAVSDHQKPYVIKGEAIGSTYQRDHVFIPLLGNKVLMVTLEVKD